MRKPFSIFFAGIFFSQENIHKVIYIFMIPQKSKSHPGRRWMPLNGFMSYTFLQNSHFLCESLYLKFSKFWRIHEFLEGAKVAPR